MKRRANYNTIHPERIIPEWPEEIRKRERNRGTGKEIRCAAEREKAAAVTLVDRKSGLIWRMGSSFKAGRGDEECDC